MDCSYSGIVEKIQNDKEVGKAVLIELSQEYVDYKDRIEEMGRTLEKMKANQKFIRSGIDNAMKHLELKLPLAIRLQDEIIVVSSQDVTFESNVL